MIDKQSFSDSEYNYFGSKNLDKEDLSKHFQNIFGDVDINQVLEEMDYEIANPNAQYLEEEQVFDRIRIEIQNMKF